MKKLKKTTKKKDLFQQLIKIIFLLLLPTTSIKSLLYMCINYFKTK